MSECLFGTIDREKAQENILAGAETLLEIVRRLHILENQVDQLKDQVASLQESVN